MRKRNVFSTGVVVLLVAAAASATTLVRMDLDELAAKAAIVARVRCLENEARVDGNEIWTFSRFEVIETLKGSAPREITVRLLGGRVGHLISTIDGVPRFRAGEELYLFLVQTRTGDFGVAGWAQGTFRLRRYNVSGREEVTQDTGSVTIFDPATRQFRPGGVRRMPVEQFRQRVREAAGRHASERDQ